MFSYNSEKLEQTLESLFLYSKDLGDITVIYQIFDEYDDQKYKRIQLLFSDIAFICIDSGINFKVIVEKELQELSSDFILLCDDTVCIHDFFDCSECIKAMHDTQAYGFYLSHALKGYSHNSALQMITNVPFYSSLRNGMCAWKFEDGEYTWHNPHSMQATIYRKKDLMNVVKPLPYSSIKELEKAWQHQRFDYGKIGLFFEQSKVYAQ